MACAATSVGLVLPRPARADTLLTRSIPSSGERVPVVGLGTWRGLSLDQRMLARELLNRMVQLGGRVVDTSPMYHGAEAAIGVAGHDLPLFVATKVWTTGRDKGRAQITRGIELMKRPVLDLVQVHNLVDWRTQLATLRELKRAGHIRHIGVTHYRDDAHAELERVIRNERVDFVQFNYSLAERAAERRLLAAAADSGVAVLVNRPYAEGALFARIRGRPVPSWAAEFGAHTHAQLFLKFILGDPRVTCVIPGTDRLAHLEDNLAAAQEPMPDAAGRARIADWYEGLV